MREMQVDARKNLDLVLKDACWVSKQTIALYVYEPCPNNFSVFCLWKNVIHLPLQLFNLKLLL